MMDVFILLALPMLFAGILALMYAAGSQRRAFLYAGYGLSFFASILCAQTRML
ncbi:hypothetical protein [Candidatus Pantoea persica]|uniref:hypothetical protein n=1 Tax=Candidatus Pantoea persica TaxID=2518128 RepID=UPI00215D6EE9|nr:hypothetical protein [Candidatus Pantoea persica]